MLKGDIVYLRNVKQGPPVCTRTKSNLTFPSAVYLYVHHDPPVLEFPSIQVVRLCHDHLLALAVRADRPNQASQVHPFDQGNQANLLKQKVVSEFNNCPTRCDLFSLLHFCRQLYMFQVLKPIIRSSYSCNYSFWY